MPRFPKLAIVPVASLVPHEYHDESRARPLVERIRASGVFSNPIITTPFNDGSGRYVVLDGANRTTALRLMGFPHALVQVVQPDDPGLDIHTWNHVIWGMPPEALIELIGQTPGVTMEACLPQQAYADLIANRVIAAIQLPNESAYTAAIENNTVERRLEALNSMVAAYQDKAQLDRTSQRELGPVFEAYKDLSGMVIFPHFDIHDVLELCRAGRLFPAGVTRSTVSPRALRVNYSLEVLASNRPQEEKDRLLQQWLQERLARKGVRYYAEATVLYDE